MIHAESSLTKVQSNHDMDLEENDGHYVIDILWN